MSRSVFAVQNLKKIHLGKDGMGRSVNAVKGGMIGRRMNRTPGEAPYPMYKIKCNHCDAEQLKNSASNIKCCQEDATFPPGKCT